MVVRKGSPKSRKGCFVSALRYFEARVLGSVPRKDLEAKGPRRAGEGRISAMRGTEEGRLRAVCSQVSC